MSAATLGLSAFLALAPQCAPNVAPETLASVIQTETRFRLYSIGVNNNGRSIASRAYDTKDDVLAAVHVLIARGVTNLDLGAAQISWRAGHLQRRGLGPEAAFEPCTALRIANDVLVDCWHRAPAGEDQARIDAASSCYNSGGFNRPEYVRAVRASAEHIVPAIRLAGPGAPPAPRPQAAAEPPKQPASPDPCAAVPAFDSWAKARCRERQRREKSYPQPQAPESKAEQ